METVVVVKVVCLIDNSTFILGVYSTEEKAVEAINIERSTVWYPEDAWEFEMSKQMVR